MHVLQRPLAAVPVLRGPGRTPWSTDAFAREALCGVTGLDATQRAALLAAFQSRCPIDTTPARAVPIELVLA
jgi:hypothetical protein